MKRLTIILLAFIVSCSSTKSTTKKCYKRTKTIVSAYWMGKMTDNYFKLKKGNYFQYYERILGLTKTNEYNGSYSLINDTLLLTFCGDTIPSGLTGKAFMDNSKNEIILFETNQTYNQHFSIRVDKR